jgi:hypothetical protein
MNESNDWQDLGRQLKTFTILVLSGLIDGGFLVLWVMIQWALNTLLKRFQLSGFDIWVFAIFQILFSIFTLIPVAIHMYSEARIMWLRAEQRIRYEAKLARAGRRDSSKNTSV